MSNEVKRYDPINSDGTCGMCIEDADYGAYVEYADYATLEAENAKLRAELERRVPAGLVLVPCEPTPEMVSAAEEAYMPFGDMDIALRMAILAAPSAPKADDPVKVQLLEALEFAARSLATMTSADGSGHADIALCVLRMAGYATDERERIVDMWKHDRQWPTDAIAAARNEGGKV